MFDHLLPSEGAHPVVLVFVPCLKNQGESLRFEPTETIVVGAVKVELGRSLLHRCLVLPGLVAYISMRGFTADESPVGEKMSNQLIGYIETRKVVWNCSPREL